MNILENNKCKSCGDAFRIISLEDFWRLTEFQSSYAESGYAIDFSGESLVTYRRNLKRMNNTRNPSHTGSGIRIATACRKCRGGSPLFLFYDTEGNIAVEVEDQRDWP